MIFYNEIKALIPNELQNYPDSTIKDILDYKSDFWKTLDISMENSDGIPRIALYNGIQNYNNLCRCKEEQILISKELLRLVDYWKVIKINIESKLDEIKDQKTLLMVYIYYYLNNYKNIIN